MPAKEAIQNGPSLHQARPDTPPNSSNSSTSGDAQLIGCPTLQGPATPLTIEHLERLLVKLIEAESRDLSDGSKPDAKPGDAKAKIARASKLEFKTVNEVWNAKEFKYKVEDSPESAEVNELDQYVFVVRVRIDRKTTEPTFYIDVKSEELRDILRKVLDGVRVSLGEDKPTVEQNMLYHYLPELESYQSELDRDSLDSKHLCLLIDHITKTYASTTATLVSLLQSKEITYNLLWAFFKSNSLVYTTCLGTGKPRCVKYDFGEEKELIDGKKYYNLECRYLDFDGEKFGEASIEATIPKFLGTKPINALEAFPLQCHVEGERVRADLIECGRKFVSLTGSHHRHCHGPAFFMRKGRPVRVAINSEVMIDAAFFEEMNPNGGSRPSVTEPQWVMDPSTVRHLSGEQSSRQIKSVCTKLLDLTEEELLICCPTVPGFSLGTKSWVEFAVASITDIEWSALPFNCLTISDEQREVIIALAEAHVNQVPGATFDDFIEGKGRGLNVLLHGPPGVGKTLTAEALSVHLNRPLYSISAGELNTSAEELESQLSQIFKIATNWNAILLLDEADVFMEQRSSQDVHRNGLVSIFLRRLEYCEGILFLTTNRVSQFDEAILSRIHLMLRYDDLSKDAGKKIWERFIERARTSQGPAKVKPDELNRLVNSKLNGRQIKNIVATAHALATKQGSCVLYSHLEMSVDANKKFITEFNGGVERQRAYM